MARQMTPEQRDKVFLALAVGAVALLAVGVFVEYRQGQTAVRAHNLDVFYKSLTCDDLPLKSDTNVAACEKAIGEYVLPEAGLFTR